MNTALSIIDAITPNTDIDYRQEMNVIHEIVAECEKEIAFMHQVHDFVYGDERHNMINRLLRLNHRPDDERIAELQAVVDQRNGECVRLMKERDELLSDQLTKAQTFARQPTFTINSWKSAKYRQADLSLSMYVSLKNRSRHCSGKTYTPPHHDEVVTGFTNLRLYQ